MRYLPMAAGVLFMTCFGLTASAATTYTSLASFNTGLSTASLTADPTETFSSDISNAVTITFGNGVKSIADNTTGGSGFNYVSSGEFQGAIGAGNTVFYDSITWNNWGSNVYAMGFDVGGLATGTGLTIEGNFDGSPGSVIIENYVPSSGFFGIISSTPFNSVKFVETNPATDQFNSFTIDNLVLARPTVIGEVPEPTSMGLMGLGLVAIGFVGRKRFQRTE